MKSKKPQLTQKRLYPTIRVTPRSKDLPATQGMLQLVRTELKEDVRELRSEMKSEFRQIDSKFSQIDSKFSQIDSKIEKVLGAIHNVAGEVARIGVLTEEQNSRNRLVLEGLTGLAERQDRLEYRIEEVETTVRSIGRSTK